MTTRCSILIATLFVVGIAAPGRAQEAAEEGFPREYLSGEGYRTGGALLGDWPELARLVRWSEGIERAVGAEDETIPDSLVMEFRTRVDTLAESPLPSFVADEVADTLRGAIERLVATLDEAEMSLLDQPSAPTRSGGEAVNVETEERALVTGQTVVRVPAGVRVGARDSLPTADVEPDALNYVERLVLALETLDEIVHIVRVAGAGGAAPISPAQTVGETSSSPRTAPLLREP